MSPLNLDLTESPDSSERDSEDAMISPTPDPECDDAVDPMPESYYEWLLDNPDYGENWDPTPVEYYDWRENNPDNDEAHDPTPDSLYEQSLEEEIARAEEYQSYSPHVASDGQTSKAPSGGHSSQASAVLSAPGGTPPDHGSSSEDAGSAPAPGSSQPPDPSPRPSGPPDFISTYADYADVLEAPREVHEAVAILLLSAVTNGFVQIQYGALSLTLDVWLLLLSGSGLGRNTLAGLAFPILEQSGHGSLLRRATWGSGPAFYEDLATNPRSLLVWPEMSQVLRTLAQSQFNGAKEWLTDRFDNPHPPDEVRYRTGGVRGSTPPIVFSQAPRTNILATSSVDWFVSSLAREDTTGGFVPRWLIVHVPEMVRAIPKPEEPDKRLINPLAEHLKKAGQLRGVADFSQVEDLYDAWYRAAQSRFAAQPDSNLSLPFFNRLRALVLKLAVINEISATCQLCVSPAAMKRALSQAASIEQTIFQLLPTGMTAEGFAIDRMEQAIRNAGVAGITQSEFTRAFQHVRSLERLDRLNTLGQSGRVQGFQRASSGGRRAGIFVHADFTAQHQHDFPGDIPNA